MKNQPLTRRQIISCCVGGIIGLILAVGLITGALQNYLTESPIPSWSLIIICIVLFCFWFYCETLKNLVIASYPKTINYKQVDLSEIINIPIDLKKIEEWDSALQAFGFKMVTEYAFESNSPIIAYGRLLVSEEHHCRAEIFQGFFQKTLQPTLALTCAIDSDLDDGIVDENSRWGLSTVNSNVNAKSALEWMLRDSHYLWSYHPDWNPAQLFSFHLEKRNEIEKTHQLIPATGLSWKDYCEDSTDGIQRRRARLLRKPGVTLFLESLFCRNKTEWWGNFRKPPST